MEFEKISDSKFKKLENEKLADLNSINGGSVPTTESIGTQCCYPDDWYLFKKNNPTNTLENGDPNLGADGEYVDGNMHVQVGVYVEC